MLKRYQDSQAFLTENPHLACEETANYLVLWCVNLEVEEVILTVFTGKSVWNRTKLVCEDVSF